MWLKHHPLYLHMLTKSSYVVLADSCRYSPSICNIREKKIPSNVEKYFIYAGLNLTELILTNIHKRYAMRKQQQYQLCGIKRKNISKLRAKCMCVITMVVRGVRDRIHEQYFTISLAHLKDGVVELASKTKNGNRKIIYNGLLKLIQSFLNKSKSR